MTLFDKVLEIYQKYSLCSNCLGRMFSLLGSYLTNFERGNSLLISITMENHGNFLSRSIERETAIKNLEILAEKANFLPAQKVLENEGLEFSKSDLNQSCYLCRNIFSNMNKYVEEAKKSLEGIEFNNFLVGTSPDSQIINQEDKFKAEFILLEAESFKSHFNRELGKRLSLDIGKPAEFNNPDVVIMYNLGFDSFRIDLIIRSVFIYGRYNKFIRGIPQTHWECRKCGGKGCESCNFSGKQYLISVEELISAEFINDAGAKGSKFHGAGREDIDVRMLGNGRPFILELKSPLKRSLDLEKLCLRVNEINEEKVKIKDLKFSSKKDVIKMKLEAENTKKVYRALVKSDSNISLDQFKKKVSELKIELENKIINQRTPFRVSHRRADKIREKKIYKIEGEYLGPNSFEFTIETQGGTYIKELISGDEDNRTKPSFAEIFGFPLNCKELDVIAFDPGALNLGKK